MKFLLLKRIGEKYTIKIIFFYIDTEVFNLEICIYIFTKNILFYAIFYSSLWGLVANVLDCDIIENKLRFQLPD